MEVRRVRIVNGMPEYELPIFGKLSKVRQSGSRVKAAPEIFEDYRILDTRMNVEVSAMKYLFYLEFLTLKDMLVQNKQLYRHETKKAVKELFGMFEDWLGFCQRNQPGKFIVWDKLMAEMIGGTMEQQKQLRTQNFYWLSVHEQQAYTELKQQVIYVYQCCEMAKHMYNIILEEFLHKYHYDMPRTSYYPYMVDCFRQPMLVLLQKICGWDHPTFQLMQTDKSVELATQILINNLLEDRAITCGMVNVILEGEGDITKEDTKWAKSCLLSGGDNNKLYKQFKDQ